MGHGFALGTLTDSSHSVHFFDFFVLGCFTLVVLLCCAVLGCRLTWDTSPSPTPSSIMQSTDDVALGLATRFMNVNKLEAHKNFGNSADNMTAVVCTIYPSTAK